MPWTNSNYPDAFNNLSKFAREMAVTVANTALKQYGDEGLAIQTALAAVKRKYPNEKSFKAQITDPQAVLCPAVWEEFALLPQVEGVLNTVAADFLDDLGIEEITVADIVIVGSLAGYNYTSQSDLDLHILLPYSQFPGLPEIIAGFFDAKRKIWNELHAITVDSHEIEIYVEDSATSDNVSNGVYSLVNSTWVKIPAPEIGEIPPLEEVSQKAADWKERIDAALRTLEQGEDYAAVQVLIDGLWQEIYARRKAALAEQGLYGLDNLVFKALRNDGYIKALIDAKNKVYDLLVEEKLWVG